MPIETPVAFRGLYDPPLGKLRYRVFYGGRGGAKSWQIARALLVHGWRRPLRVLCAREYQSSIRESVHHLLVDQIDKLNLWGSYTVLQSEIIGSNGTSFIFKGIRLTPNAVRSTEAVDVCWVEEGHAVSEQSWQILIPTIRRPGSEIWVSFNPGEATDPTWQRFVVNPPPRSLVQKVGYRDNPWLTDVLLEEARTMQERDPEAYAHVWGGEPWTRSDTQVLSGKTIIEDFEPGEDWDGPYYGADWGFANDPTVLTSWYRHADRLWLRHEAGGVGLDMDQTDRAFRAVPGAAEHTIRADGARPETINEMNKRGLRVVAAPKWQGSVEDGIAHLRSYTQIVIHPSCTRAQQEARLYRYKTNKAGDVLPQIVDAYNHTWDSGRYALAPFIRQRRSPRVIVHG